jgi:agmatinase
MDFDPNAAAMHDGLYGLPFDTNESRFVVIPVPYDATTSYRDGTRNGPAAVLEASYQVDLFDLDFGRPWQSKIAMLSLDTGVAREIAQLNREARVFAEPVIEAGGEVAGKPKLQKALREVNARSQKMCILVEREARRLIEAGKTPVVLGGDHSTPFGAIKAYADAFPGLGILHIDAHADLRVAFEGFEWSHASIMHNVTSKVGRRGGVAELVQVGIRDFGENEFDAITRKKGRDDTRITTYFDSGLQAAKFRGEGWATLCDEIVSNLPKQIYVSVDIDGFDPKLCPDTGTPVPGGLEFGEFVELLRAVRRAKKKIVGFDLNEVAPSRALKRDEWGGDWNANVGARVLYKLVGAAASSGQ